ncbi:MAG TPA: polyprenyl diphosphate synthase [Armatimonadota bacterium]|jgi:undecaprenyl diphosphate synthase|nr:di-trans,poly-cis-decaprenylcistransferase [Armatimonadota bacterium]HOJ21553.1 polyprenyl diphosphate synthase [Armatimonadota bacterium]HOM81638.1 polyprenyl diphosphate synthase [Armatimonadota bacterium]HOQ28895.1 polyprenyl diphosphate synthase [Armatimonadota bacterium]HPO71481.1 polyprenyl diphosphate synthase [Armatimonadota bacterium]
MGSKQFARLPRHVGFIPDGNRRWAEQRGLPRSEGYAAGIEPGLLLLDECARLGIAEVSIYGFTQENTRRPKEQTQAFRAACVEFALRAAARGVALRVLGDATSPVFPPELIPYAERRVGPGPLRVNLLVNYGWAWDLENALRHGASAGRRDVMQCLASADASRLDLVVRWGGRCRLSGFLPVQSVYADLYVVDALWPDFQIEQFHEALRWHARQDVTLGG